MLLQDVLIILKCSLEETGLQNCIAIFGEKFTFKIMFTIFSCGIFFYILVEYSSIEVRDRRLCWQILDSLLFTIHNLTSVMKKHFSSNSEAFASELLENLEEMFPCYYMYCDTFLHAQIFSHIIMNILEITMHVVLRKYFFNIF